MVVGNEDVEEIKVDPRPTGPLSEKGRQSRVR